MGPRSIRNSLSLLAAALMLVAAPASAPDAFGEPKSKKSTTKSDAKTAAKTAKPAASKSRIDEYLAAKAAYEKSLDAYWDDIAAKRRACICRQSERLRNAISHA